nr:histidine kinase N-terminal 7TM domain-containing protein [Ardenticatena sp.]
MNTNHLLLELLNRLNLAISAANLLLTFSLFVYIITHNFRNSAARAFAALLGFVTIVNGVDVVIAQVNNPAVATGWLKLQWIGIAMVPAAYLHFSDALLRSTGNVSRFRRGATVAAYATGGLFFVLVWTTDLIVDHAVAYAPWATQLTAGPFFWFFVAYFFITSAWGFANTLWARQRALTPTSRRRMTYLVASFAAPGLAVYPYLLLASLPARLPPLALIILLLVGNIGVGTMIVVMTYSVAYLGALAPDRVIKHDLVTYIFQGPLLGLFILAAILLLPPVEEWLGLPRETVLIFIIIGGIIFYQVILQWLKPVYDLLVYQRDRSEIQLWRALRDRMLTASDINQVLENILTSICDLLRIEHGFVIVLDQGRFSVAAASGDARIAQTFLQAFDLTELAGLNGNVESDDLATWPERHGLRLYPLRSQDGALLLGLLAVQMPTQLGEMSDRERSLLDRLLKQAQISLEDRHLQQGVLTLLKQLKPQFDNIQRWRTTIPYAASPTLLSNSTLQAANFPQLVKDALRDYWGGPRLTQSPLLNLRVVRQRLGEFDNNPAKALRAVLTDAMNALKPDEGHTHSQQEWLLYNILNLKFIQGYRARDVAQRLAMSESDLYRKQRAAIEELARAILAMEQALAQEESAHIETESATGKHEHEDEED